MYNEKINKLFYEFMPHMMGKIEICKDQHIDPLQHPIIVKKILQECLLSAGNINKICIDRISDKKLCY